MRFVRKTGIGYRMSVAWNGIRMSQTSDASKFSRWTQLVFSSSFDRSLPDIGLVFPAYVSECFLE
jgi:hypothetical protein